jgi:outer membrane protein OmpA-like peptidoglycan-associated protein
VGQVDGATASAVDGVVRRLVWHPDHDDLHAHRYRARVYLPSLSPTLLLLLLLLSACAGPRERIVLLGAEPGEALTVTTATGTTTLTAPDSTANIWKGGKLLLGTLPPATIQERYGAVIATAPEGAATYTFRFATGKAGLSAEGRVTLGHLLAEVHRRGPVEVVIEGHCDQVGTDAANDALSLARAEAVRALLVQGGLTATFVRVTGRGERQPVIDAPERPEPKNRRVEVTVR